MFTNANSCKILPLVWLILMLWGSYWQCGQRCWWCGFRDSFNVYQTMASIFWKESVNHRRPCRICWIKYPAEEVIFICLDSKNVVFNSISHLYLLSRSYRLEKMWWAVQFVRLFNIPKIYVMIFLKFCKFNWNDLLKISSTVKWSL